MASSRLVRHRFNAPDELQRNHPDIHALGAERTGSALLRLAAERLGLADLGGSDVLDVGCGVRFTQALINCEIPIKSYTGVDVHLPLIDHLRREIDDPRFRFAHWDARNAKYNPDGVPMTSGSRLPVAGAFDIVWLFSVFTHLDPADADALLAILRRHVRPGGALLFSAFLDDTIETFEARVPEQPLDHPCYSTRYMRQLAEANGWSVASVHPPSPDHYVQHHLVCRPRAEPGGLEPIFLHKPHGWPAVGITPEVEAEFAALVREVLDGPRRPGEAPADVRFVTYRNYDAPSLVERSYAMRGIGDVAVLARDAHPWSWLAKVEPFLAYLETSCRETYVVATDATDVLLVADPSSIVERFAGFGCDVLFCGTAADWPPAPEAWAFESSVYPGHPYHCHLSAGAFMGRREALVALLREIMAGAREGAAWTRTGGGFDDQLSWRHMHLLHHPRVQVDVEAKIFKRFDTFRDRL